MSTILDALRKAQAEGGGQPEASTPEFPPPPPIDQPPPSDDQDPPSVRRSPPYRAIGVVVLGVSLGLLLGRLLLPWATTDPDSSDLLADGVAAKHEDLAAVKAETERRAGDEAVSPAELRRKKREDAKAGKQREDDSIASDQNAVADAPQRLQPSSAGAPPGRAASDGADPDRPEVAGDAEAAAEPPETTGVAVPRTLPRPESPPLGEDDEGAGLPASTAGASATTSPVAANGATASPRVLGDVIPATPMPAADPGELPEGLDALGSDPLTDGVAALAPPADAEAALEPVTSPPPPSPNAPEPRALPNAPDDAPKIWLLFIQWSNTPEKRVVSLRQEGGGISIVREGEIVQGMRLAAIHPSGVEFQWRGQSFVVPVSRY